MKKVFAGAVSALILSGSLAGCGHQPPLPVRPRRPGRSSAQKDPGEKVYISVATSLVGTEADVLEKPL